MTGLFKARGATVATAESCTGGRVAAAFTASAGASDYFRGGVVAYSNDVKMNVLGVSSDDLQVFGAVSRQVAEAMARGVRRVTGADYAIATTGIAGPGGGSPEKPIGTVWMAVSGPGIAAGAGAGDAAGVVVEGAGDMGAVVSRVFHFDGTRAEIMARATEAAIEMLAGCLQSVSPQPHG